MKRVLLIIVALFFSIYLFCQNESAVLDSNLAGTYKGDLKKGIANGMGEAVGIDSYKGEFKKGLPNGEGKYIWSTGEIYEGAFSKGERHGWGKLSFKIEGKDSVLEGYFYENKFLGDKKVPDPDYKVLTSLNVARNSVQPLNGVVNQVIVKFETTDDPYGILFQASSGSRTDENLKQYRYEFVEYPFKLNIRYKVPSKDRQSEYNCDYEILINKPGTWKISLYN